MVNALVALRDGDRFLVEGAALPAGLRVVSDDEMHDEGELVFMLDSPMPLPEGFLPNASVSGVDDEGGEFATAMIDKDVAVTLDYSSESMTATRVTVWLGAHAPQPAATAH